MSCCAERIYKMSDVNTLWSDKVRQGRYLYNPHYLLRANLYLDKSERLRPAGQRLLEILFSFDGEKDGQVFPSQQKLADILGVNIRHIPNKLDKLEADGWLKKVKKRINGKQYAQYIYDLSPAYKRINALAEKFPPEKLKNAEVI